MKIISLALSAFIITSSVTAALAQDAVVTDSRIKTLVYNPNDVFSLLTVYGYQSNIEFSVKEEIQTVSVGDRVGWQIVASGHRLFIRPQEFSAHTNMTVITNKRSYQFDLKSAPDENLPESEELVYVVRFFYPEENASSNEIAFIPPQSSMGLSSVTNPEPASPTNIVQASEVLPLPATMSTSLGTPPNTSHVIPQPTSQEISAPTLAMSNTAQNYNYTYSGSLDYAPTRIYDNGTTTFITIPQRYYRTVNDVTFTSVQNGPIKANLTPEGVFVFDTVLNNFTIKYKDNTEIQVFNESNKKN